MLSSKEDGSVLNQDLMAVSIGLVGFGFGGRFDCVGEDMFGTQSSTYKGLGSRCCFYDQLINYSRIIVILEQKCGGVSRARP